MVKGEAVSCEQVWRDISNYLDGELTAPLRAALDDHFLTCQRCRSVLEGTRNVIGLYTDERMIEVPTGFGRRLEKRLARSAESKRSHWSSWSAWLIPVAALALFAGGLRWANSISREHPVRSQLAQPAKGIPPEMKVVVSEGARDFHVPGCDLIHNKDKERTLTAREAIGQGYVPCVRCLRKYLETASNRPVSLQNQPRAELDMDSEDPQQAALR